MHQTEHQSILKLLRSLLGFGLFFSVFYGVFIFVWGRFLPQEAHPNLRYLAGNGGYLKQRLQEVKTEKNLDILFIGSSRAYRGFDTRIFEKEGWHCFNLGSSNQSPLQSAYFIRRYRKLLCPKLIVFEVNPEYFQTDGAESSLDLFANERLDANALSLLIAQCQPLIWNSFTYAFLNQTLFHVKIPSTTSLEDCYHRGGYVEKKKRPTASETLTQPSPTRLDQRACFKDLIHELKRQKQAYLLVQAPTTISRRKRFKYTAAFDKQMQKLGPYLNGNQLLPTLSTSDFYDSHHLSQQGVAKWNHCILLHL